jgi:hypothetical protein
MRKFLCIILFVFTRIICSGEATAYNLHYTEKKTFCKSQSISLSFTSVIDKETPDEAPGSKKRKKRIKGLTYEFLPAITHNKLKPIVTVEEQLLNNYLVVSSNSHFCNGKRGPPLR